MPTSTLLFRTARQPGDGASSRSQSARCWQASVMLNPILFIHDVGAGSLF
ncbi:hypothetical protein ACULNC_13490 [Shigella flexneri]